ncbi:MAG: hypothetical protein PHU85_19130 [Phycisphaerae bacterium]|nr:hypothetical protein [Phycisphaerae bacterium]
MSASIVTGSRGRFNLELTLELTRQSRAEACGIVLAGDASRRGLLGIGRV